MAIGFSRLQLAAALLEYDNDPDNPDAPKRSAHDSAIFAHLRRNLGTRPRTVSHKSLEPFDSRSTVRRESAALSSRESRASIDALRNPFGDDDPPDSETGVEEDEIEVDLTSWGLDAFMPKDKSSKSSKGKMKANDGAAQRSAPSVPSHRVSIDRELTTVPYKRAISTSRSASLGGALEFAAAGLEHPNFKALPRDRRRSLGSALDNQAELAHASSQRRRALSLALSTPQFIPFPASSNNRVTSGEVQRDVDDGIPEQLKQQFGDVDFEDSAKPGRVRTISNGTLATALLTEDNPFAVRPPSRASRFDPKAAAHARTTSFESSRMLGNNDAFSVATGHADHDRTSRFSTTLELLRPKVLVMPSPLQTVAPPPPTADEKVRDGFQLSTDGPPLPPGARTSRRLSSTFSTLQNPPNTPPVASNSFTPNPSMTLSLSQMTFRNTLSPEEYTELNIPRATQDGEQALFDTPVTDEPPLSGSGLGDTGKTGRPAGKLFGKSLIDNLEERKAEMRNKQRVFTGDQRPSMMSRSQTRSSTLIDPESLNARPTNQRTSSYGLQGSRPLSRRLSLNAKPLLNFDDENDKVLPIKTSPLPPTRSVFGVDKLWEREMAKLREIEAQEKIEAKERKRKEEEEEKKAKTKKRKNQAADDTAQLEVKNEAPAQPRVSVEPPVLPDIQRAPRGRPPPQRGGDADGAESDDSDDEEAELPRNSGEPADDPNWFAGSSDEEDETHRSKVFDSKRPKQPPRPAAHDDEDVPLSLAFDRALRSGTHLFDHDSDDERPLSVFLREKPLASDLGASRRPANADDEEDDKPLGLRVGSRRMPSSADEDDDDQPLAFHPEQRRKTQQLQFLTQQQQQQQQMMLQAQMHNSMFFPAPSLVGAPFYGPSPMMPVMVQPSLTMPSTPPPMQDESKFGRVDKWRRDVAVEGGL